jgi:hypothetical protein
LIENKDIHTSPRHRRPSKIVGFLWHEGASGQQGWGGFMLAYRCPVTKKFVEATIKTPESKLRSLGSVQLPLWCRVCHCAHAVSAQEIFVAEEA